ncbi:post-GPI attachment to proteins factor 2 isoform X12 [Gorilla gorilla gorilla]|uniref:post-GPI attachment to proteins factor 2 isoform X5 n=1 Tax=Pan paniscus TaxID=9597 RepID=UPI0004F08E49|nr:post-GPI attachment to proteins factor 2 isoform X6 [Pan paniscus]XP_018892321.1 post-GPI attachment to proteins factor 2 isoform X17 [Gorilla gorilla gorilla]XP_054517903.1 post-GPI attachment to proteins factor 2 isoform X19 [Pan troglodytes]
MARLGSTGGVSGRVVTQHRDSAPFLGALRLGLRELGPIRGTAPEWHGDGTQLRGAQLPALGELSHRRGGAPALRVAFLHRPALGASLLGGLRLLEPLPQLHLPVFLLSPALPPQLRPQCRGEPRVASAHLCLLLRGLHRPRKCFHCVHCLIPRAHAPHLHSLAVDQEAHSKSGGSQVLQLETAALHHQLHLLLLGAGCLLSAQHVL